MPNHDAHGHNGHDHHGHSHHSTGHSHAPANFGKAFAIGITLNIVFVAIEAGFGWWSNSMALLADAGHNLSDVLGLVVAWAAAIAGKRKATELFTYGFGNTSILAALFNAMFLLVAVGIIIWEAIERFNNPVPVGGVTVMVVATIGIFINGITAWLFASGQKGDINIRGAYLHMAADAAVSAGVVVGGLLILFTGWNWLDSVISLIVAGIIIWSTWGLLKSSLKLSIAAVPQDISYQDVQKYLLGLSGVTSIHDLHIWPLSTTQTALTCHLIMPVQPTGDTFLHTVAADLEKRFKIEHVTIQIESEQEKTCHTSLLHV